MGAVPKDCPLGLVEPRNVLGTLDTAQELVARIWLSRVWVSRGSGASSAAADGYHLATP